MILAAEAMLKGDSSSLPPEKRQYILEALIRARNIGADQNPAWKPTALKVQGLAHEALSQVQEAIACYEEALSLNPKIGVKRKHDSLRKRAGA
ncbi:tetratricopeptide repeat protein [Pseudomonas putida]|nr:tetratricopeptide repeat protein [Pseudomonas putida]